MPLVFAFLNLAEPGWAMLAYLPMIACMAASAPALATVTQGIVRPEMRSMSYTTQYMVTSLLGMGGGPFLVGLTNDLLAPRLGELAIRYSMLGVIGTTALVCGLDVLLGKPKRRGRHGLGGSRRGALRNLTSVAPAERRSRPARDRIRRAGAGRDFYGERG